MTRLEAAFCRFASERPAIDPAGGVTANIKGET
jgi:hypothetical protein